MSVPRKRASLTRTVSLLAAAVLLMLAVPACSRSSTQERESALETALAATSSDVISAGVDRVLNGSTSTVVVSIVVTTDHTEVTATELRTYLRLIVDNTPFRADEVEIMVLTEDRTFFNLLAATTELDLRYAEYRENDLSVTFIYDELVEDMGAAP